MEIPILVNSEETKARLIEKFPSLKNQFKVLPNLVPDEFFEYEKNSHVEKPREIAIVSNHVPKELLITKKMLEKQNIKVDIYGNGGTKQNIKIEPQILINYDAIITIGKTVQYALALGIPVYNYDYMGGSGYINLKNIDTEEFYNFSGRSFERKLTPVELVEEILTGYKANLQDVKALQAIARERYLLSKNINKVIQDIECSPNTIIEQSEQWILYSTQISCLIDEIIMYRNRANSIKQKIFRVVVKHYKNTLQKVKNFL